MFINNNRRKHRKVRIYEKRKNHTSSVEIEPYRSRRRAAIIRRENDIGLRVSATYCVLCSRVCTTTDIFDADFRTTGIEVMTDAVKFMSVKIAGFRKRRYVISSETFVQMVCRFHEELARFNDELRAFESCSLSPVMSEEYVKSTVRRFADTQEEIMLHSGKTRVLCYRRK